MVKRLREDRQDVLESAREIVETTRTNMSNQARIHGAVLALLEARNFEDFIRTITIDFAALLDVDIVSLIIETDTDSIPHINIPGVRVMPPGTIDMSMEKNAIVLQAHITGLVELYGSGANLVKSQALLRLDIAHGIPPALISFGSSNPEMFEDGQATDLIVFLGSVIERSFCAWLNVPDA